MLGKLFLTFGLLFLIGLVGSAFDSYTKKQGDPLPEIVTVIGGAVVVVSFIGMVVTVFIKIWI